MVFCIYHFIGCLFFAFLFYPHKIHFHFLSVALASSGSSGGGSHEPTGDPPPLALSSSLPTQYDSEEEEDSSSSSSSSGSPSPNSSSRGLERDSLARLLSKSQRILEVAEHDLKRTQMGFNSGSSSGSNGGSKGADKVLNIVLKCSSLKSTQEIYEVFYLGRRFGETGLAKARTS